MLRARLLGALEVELNGAVIDSPASQRPWAVFAYLALRREPGSAGELAATFWPDVLDQSARASLRSALWALRRQLGDALAVDGERVGLRDEPGLWVDVREFDRLATGDPAAALELCRGDLLEGVEDDWAVSARDRHRERVIELLEELADAAERARRGPRGARAHPPSGRPRPVRRGGAPAADRAPRRRRRSRRRDARLPGARRAPAARARGGALAADARAGRAAARADAGAPARRRRRRAGDDARALLPLARPRARARRAGAGVDGGRTRARARPR